MLKGFSMASSRVLVVHTRPNAARDKLQAKVDKGAAQEKLGPFV